MSGHSATGYEHIVDARVAMLAANESPVLPERAILQAVEAELLQINRYPDPGAGRVRTAISERLNLPCEQILVGHGASELLLAIGRSQVGHDDQVVFAWPSYYAYPQLVALTGGIPRPVALDGSLRHDLHAMAEAVSSRSALVLICNPNNPTGTAVAPGAIRSFLDFVPRSVPVVLDEAYHEFNRLHSAKDEELISAYPNVVRLRTFSKAHRLAGARIGYAAFGDPALARQVDSVRAPFPVSNLAQAAAVAALSGQARLNEHVENSVRRRERLQRGLERLGLAVADSETNFLWLEPPAGWSDRELSGRLAEMQVRVAIGSELCDQPGLRITAGSDDEIDRLLQALGSLVGERSR